MLLISIVKPVIQSHKSLLQPANVLLQTWMARLNLGKNYRNACRMFRGYRGSVIEDDVRNAVSRLSRWSLAEIISVAFELSPLFYSAEFRILDATICRMYSKPELFSTVLIRKALEHACPVIFDIRATMRPGECPGGLNNPFHARSSHFLEILHRIPKIRLWREAELQRGVVIGEELVLRHRDLTTAASSGLTNHLRDLSTRNTLVHYGEAGASKRGEFGRVRVFTFNCHDLRRLYVNGTICAT
jgi:hypothetical protein